MKKLLPVMLVMTIIAVFGCEQQVQEQEAPAPEPVDYAAITAQLENEQQQYADAWCNKDMDAISRIWSHDDDITIWGPGERSRVQGWEGENGVKAFYQGAFDGAQSIDFKISDVLVKVSKEGTAAVVTYYIENDFVDLEGNAHKMTPRVTVVRELVDGAWKTIHGDASFSIAEMEEMLK